MLRKLPRRTTTNYVVCSHIRSVTLNSVQYFIETNFVLTLISMMVSV